MIQVYYNVYINVDINTLANQIAHLSAIYNDAKDWGINADFKVDPENVEVCLSSDNMERLFGFILDDDNKDAINPYLIEVDGSIQYKIARALFPESVDVEW